MISIIVPAYNVESSIIRTLKSLAGQSNKNFEVIIINDGSTDNTETLISEFIKANRYINFRLINKENRGVSSARNIGIKESMGEFLLFLDGDDTLSHNCIEKVIANIYNKDIDVLVYGYNLVNEKSHTKTNLFDVNQFPDRIISGEEAFSDIVDRNRFKICMGSSVYSSKMLKSKSILFTEDCHSGEDTEFTLKALMVSKKVKFLRDTLMSYVVREGSLTNSFNIKKFQSIYAIRRIQEFVNQHGSLSTQDMFRKKSDEMVITRYLGHYNTSLSYINETTKNYKHSLVFLNNEIDTTYPMLRKNISFLTKHYKGCNLILMIKIRIFLISPMIYNKAAKIKRIT